jgi:hypothetical protein
VRLLGAYAFVNTVSRVVICVPKRSDNYTYLLSYLPTYVFTPFSRFLLEKLTGFQLVKKFPIFYGTRRFITAFTGARHLSLS